MSEGRIIIGNSSYSNIKLQVEDEEFKDISVDLKKFHIFHNDIVNVVDGRITAISEEISKYRNELLPGILEITGIKKYGFTKRGTPIYLWRPFDKVPCFTFHQILERMCPTVIQMYIVLYVMIIGIEINLQVHKYVF